MNATLMTPRKATRRSSLFNKLMFALEIVTTGNSLLLSSFVPKLVFWQNALSVFLNTEKQNTSKLT